MILLNTSNKSELATGYGTLYGDMAGGFAVLKDVYKSFVYDLIGLHHIRLKGILGQVYKQKMWKNFKTYLKLMLKNEAPLDIKLLYTCLKRIWL